MRFVSFLLCCVSACAAIDAAATHLGGAERQLDPYSPFVRELKERPLPADWQGVRVIAHLMSYAHDVEATASLVRLVEREALLEILGEPMPPRPARVEDAIREMSGAAKVVQVLGVRVLDKALLAELIQDHEPRDEGNQRAIGVRIVNPGAHEVLGGFIELEIGTPPKAARFSCRFNEPIAAGASRAMPCYGDRARPLADVLAAIRAAAGRQVKPLGQYEIAYRLRGERFTVGGANAGLRGDEQKIEKVALDMLHDQSCGARRACGAAVAEELANPLVAGFVLGIAASFVVLLVAWIGGLKAGAWVGTGIVVVLAVLSAAFVIGVAVMTSKAHILLMLLLAGAAAGHMGQMATGFLIGVAAFMFVAKLLGSLVRRIRAA